MLGKGGDPMEQCFEASLGAGATTKKHLCTCVNYCVDKIMDIMLSQFWYAMKTDEGHISRP